MSLQTINRPRHSFQTDDAALVPIAAKVEAGERLTFEDGLALYRMYRDLASESWFVEARYD